jgi:hypothetical protein
MVRWLDPNKHYSGKGELLVPPSHTNPRAGSQGIVHEDYRAVPGQRCPLRYSRASSSLIGGNIGVEEVITTKSNI